VDVTFFTEVEDNSFNSFDEIPEDSILGGGRFTKDNISELLGCFKSGSSAQTDNLWLLSISFSETLSIIDDESLKNIAVHWSEESSWENTDVNPTDLENHLLELKYSYSHSSKRIWVFFE
jgi:hypothetical protein